MSPVERHLEVLEGYDGHILPERQARIRTARELLAQGYTAMLSVMCLEEQRPYDALVAELHSRPEVMAGIVGPLVLFEAGKEPFVPHGTSIWQPTVR